MKVNDVLNATKAKVNAFIATEALKEIHAQLISQKLVATGHLLNSIQTRTTGVTAPQLHIDMADYGVMLELGTREIPPKAFVRKAINDISLERLKL